MDKVLSIKSDDIMAPGPILEYQHEGTTHLYITDFYYQPYNLIIEVKDGGDNPNKRNMPEYRQKQIEKEQYIIKYTNYNYLRLTNNDLQQLMSVFAMLKLQMVENTGERVIHVNENTNPINEYMNALTSGKVIGLKDSDAYIVNYLPKQTFTDEEDDERKRNPKLGVSNGTFTKIAATNEEGILTVYNFSEEVDISAGCSYYKLDKNTSKVNDILSSHIGESVSPEFVYESLTGKKMYTFDQIPFTLECINDKIIDIPKMVKDYILPDKIEKISESIKEVINNG